MHGKNLQWGKPPRVVPLHQEARSSTEKMQRVGIGSTARTFWSLEH
jgi:hypothetical protein